MSVVLLLATFVRADAQRLVLPGLGTVPDRRHPIDLQSPPWRGLCRVQTELGGRCTGFLIGPRNVITAAHCLWLPRPRHFVRPDSVHVLLRYAAGQWAAHGQAAAITIGPGYDPARRDETAGADWAIITLPAPLGGAGDVMPMLEALPAPEAQAMLGGYNQDRAEVAVADTDCRVLAMGRDAAGHLLFRHNCAATRGSSGGALLVRDRDGVWHVAGVQSLAEMGGTGGFAARP